MRAIILVFLFSFLTQGIFASEKEFNAPKLALGFVKNEGQILNQFGSTNREVLYSYEAGQMHVHLRKNGFSYQLVQTEYEQGMEAIDLHKKLEPKSYRTHRIEIDFEGANDNIEQEESTFGVGKLIYHSKQHADESMVINHYKKIVYKNVYNYVDIEFVIGNDAFGKSQFKYNIILHPGAKAAQVKLKINGANSIQIKENGSLSIATSLGDITEEIPFSYELEPSGIEGKFIEVKYKKLGTNLFGFTGIKQFLSKPLVIDPVAWVTYFGGSLTDNSGGVITDKDSNVYVVGRTYSSSGIATVGSYQSFYNGGTQLDVYLAKFSSAGALIWATYYGGSGDDSANDIEIDVFNNIVIAGTTYSSSGIVTGTAMQSTLLGPTDCFIARFSGNGGLLYGTYYGYGGSEYLLGICTDKTGAVYATGNTNSTVSLTPGVHQQNNAGNSDAFVMKMAYPATFSFATYYGGTAVDYGTEIIVDFSKNVYLAGYTTSPNGIASTGAYKATLGGVYDGFQAKFDSIGRRVFSTYFGGSGNEYFYDLCWDSEGKIIISGYTTSTTNISLGSVFQPSFGGGSYDGLISKFDTSGNPIWVSYAGGTSDDFIYSIATDNQSNIYLSGGTNSLSGIATIGAIQTSYGGGGYDCYFLKLDKNGNRIWSTYFGSSGQEFGREVTTDLNGACYFTGETFSTTGISTIGAHQTNLAGGSDSYLFKYVETIVEAPIANNVLSANQGLCTGSIAAIIIGSTPSGGNGTFTYQWLYSNTGVAGTFSVASGVNTGIDYDPGSISSNAYYKRVVNSGSYSDTSATHSIIFSTGINAGFVVNKTIQCVKTNQFIFTDTTTSSAGTLSYYWDFGNGKTSINQVDTVVYDFAVNNGYQVKLVTSLNGGCADTSVLNVFTIANPMTKNINGKDTVLKGTTEVYNVTGTVGSNYNWIFSNGNGRSYTNTLNIKWTQVGDVQLKMVETNSGSCLGDTAIKNIYVKQPTSEEELFGSDLKIYPNPSEGIVYVEMDKIGKYSMEVFTLAGKIIYQDIVNKQVQINLGQEPAGLYLLVLTNEQGEIHHRKIQLIK